MSLRAAQANEGFWAERRAGDYATGDWATSCEVKHEQYILMETLAASNSKTGGSLTLGLD